MMTLLLLDVPSAQAAAPTITSFNPTSGPVGTSVQINGTGFQDGSDVSAVTFNGTAATFTVNSDVLITATVPSGASDGNIEVTDSEGTAMSPSNFDVTAPLPTITAFTPMSGPVGTSVTILGTNFTGVTAVTFGGTAAAFTFNNDTQITATVPMGATTGLIAVTTPGGTATSATNFNVTGPGAPTITSFNPTSGPVGTSVTITGTNFTGTTFVRFNGVQATFTVNSNTQITATVPTGATTGPITVTTPIGTATSSTNFTVVVGPVPVEKHRSNVTLKLSGHLVANGKVNVPDGTKGCKRGRVVKIQRAKGGSWRTVKKDHTSSTGAYRASLPDREGKYRSVVKKEKISDTDVCLSDVSRTRKHNHPEELGGGGGGGGGTQNCTAGYSPCLIYHGGADYDCFGGSGNGPYYTEPGVVYTVTGSDPYDLDADSDGRGCE
jgi:hypothetical protein